MSTAKTIFIGILCLIIVGCAIFLYVGIENRGDEQNAFHRNVKSNIVKIHWLRSFLRLHDAGDASYDLLHTPGPFEFVVTAMEGIPVDRDALQIFVDSVTRDTGIAASFAVSQAPIPFSDQIPDENIHVLLANSVKKTGGKKIYMYLVSRNASRPTLLGLTHGDRGIMLYVSAIEDVTNNNPAASSAYLLSTALHEFGHQLGLQHTMQKKCIMNEYVEVYTDQNKDLSTPTDFCDSEKQQIQDIESIH